MKRAECWRFDTFELWCWKRLFRVHWTAKGSNQSILQSTLNIHWKDWCWGWSSNTLVTWCEELTHWKRPWCWERLSAEGEGRDRRWDDWTASPTQWTWVCTNSRRQWWTGRPGVLQPMGSQSRTQLCNYAANNGGYKLNKRLSSVWNFMYYLHP